MFWDTNLNNVITISKTVFKTFCSIFQQHRDGHRSDAPGDGCDPSRNLLHALEIHVAAEFPFSVPVHSDVYDHCSGLDHVRGNEALPAHGHYQDIGLAGDCPKVCGARVRDGHGGIGVQQKFGHGLAHDVAPAHDHGVASVQGDAGGGQQAHYAFGRAGNDAVPAQLERAHVQHVESVHVLVHGNGVYDLVLINMLGKWELDEYAVHSVVRIEFPDEGEQFLLGNALGKGQQTGFHPGFLGGLHLVADIYLARRVLPHDDYAEARNPAVLFPEPGNLRLDVFPYESGDSLAVDDLCCHILELEINECLKVCGYELIEYEYHRHDGESHHGKREHCEIDAVPALEAVRQPVDGEAGYDEGEDAPVLHAYLWDDVDVPRRAYLVDHVARGGRGRKGA